MKPLIGFITNFVTMNDVATACLTSGARPVMPHETEEIKDVMEQVDGFVLNTGTISPERFELLLEACNNAKSSRTKLLLDTVGCGMSKKRLDYALELLAVGTVNVLKVNPKEAKSLFDGYITKDKTGVDSQPLSTKDKMDLAISLHNKYKKDQHLCVIITGKTDVIYDGNQSMTIDGGCCLQGEIVGTGCMLNAVLMSYLVKSDRQTNWINLLVRGLKHMNRASELAFNQLNDKRHLASYKVLLLDMISATANQLYLISDEKMAFKSELMPKTEIAISQGVDILQYRAKNKSYDDLVEEAQKMKALTTKHGIPLIINDYVRLAKMVDAEGVHIGQQDNSVAEVRAYLGEKSLIGATAKTVEQAVDAEIGGADYLGVGALYKSPTKKDAIGITIDTLKEIYCSTTIPIYGIGGLTKENVTEEIKQYTDGIVMVSGIYSQID